MEHSWIKVDRNDPLLLDWNHLEYLFWVCLNCGVIKCQYNYAGHYITYRFINGGLYYEYQNLSCNEILMMNVVE